MSLESYFDAINRFDFDDARHIASLYGGFEEQVLLSFIDFLEGDNLGGLKRLQVVNSSVDPFFRGFSYLCMAYHHYFLGDMNRFEEDLTRAESFIDDMRGHILGLYYHLKGLNARVRGDILNAKKFYDLALEVREGIGDYWGAGVTLNNLAFLNLSEGQIQVALSLNFKGRQMFEKAGNLAFIGFSDANRAIIELQLGNFDVAEQLLEGALKMYEESGAPAIYTISAKKTYAQVLFEKGFHSEAISLLEASLLNYGGSKVSPSYIDLLTELIRMKLRSGDGVERELEVLERVHPLDPSSAYKKLSVRVEVLRRGSLIDKVRGLLLAEDALGNFPNISEGYEIRLNLLEVAIETRLELLAFELDRKSIEVLEREIEELRELGERENSLRFKVESRLYNALIHYAIGENLIAEKHIEEAIDLAIKEKNEILMKQVESKASSVKRSLRGKEESKLTEIIDYLKQVSQVIQRDLY